jgi:hypothetical protein
MLAHWVSLPGRCHRRHSARHILEIKWHCRRLITVWQQAVSRVPVGSIVPLGLGGSQDVSLAAYHGDKILSAAVANAQRHLQRPDDVVGVGELTTEHNLATSNDFLLSQLADILPEHGLSNKLVETPHLAVTMVEAAVFTVHEEDGSDAVDDLARHLVRGASAVSVDEPNPKGALLELGGSVSSERTGGTDHEPVFRATAELAEQRMIVTVRGSKADAEFKAATSLLDSVFGEY